MILEPSFLPPKPSIIHYASPLLKAELILKSSLQNKNNSSSSSSSSLLNSSSSSSIITNYSNIRGIIREVKQGENEGKREEGRGNDINRNERSNNSNNNNNKQQQQQQSSSSSTKMTNVISSKSSSHHIDLFEGEIQFDSESLLSSSTSSSSSSEKNKNKSNILTTTTTTTTTKPTPQLAPIFNQSVAEPKKKETINKQKSKQESNNSIEPKQKKTRKTTNTNTNTTTSPPISPSPSPNSISNIQNSREVPQVYVPSFEDFKGIEAFCRNAGSSNESLQALVTKCSNSESVSIVFFWPDGNSTHANTSTKLCTPSRPCGIWNCNCDRNLRSNLTESPLLGALICLENDIIHPYFLPLEAQGSIGWSTLESILLLTSTSKVIYHTQIVWFLITHYFGSSSPHKYKNLFDPRIATYLCDSTASEQDLELSSICGRFSISPQKRVPRVQMGKIALQCLSLYEDLQCLIQLYQTLKQKLKEYNSFNVFQGLEMPLSCLLSRMEYQGLKVSLPTLEEISSQLTNEIKTIETESHQLVKQDFNLSSPEQVAHILYDILHLSPTPTPTTSTNTNSITNTNSNISTGSSSTNSGQVGTTTTTTTTTKKHASTSEDTLIHLSDQHPIVDLILQHRHMTKIYSTFIEGMRSFVNLFREDEYRVHACWNQTNVRTGRLSCAKPNLQNIPNERTVRNILINPRSIFCASPGSVLISADYSQIEMRILAHVCGDESMRKLFRQSGDIYLTLAGLIFDKQPQLVTKTERERAKTICLGVMYGMGLQAVATKLSIDVNTASSIMQSFYRKFPTVKLWIKKTKSDALQTGYVSTIMGRRRHLPDIQSTNSAKKSQAERQAVNSIIQGTASDIIKYAMLCVEEEIDQLSLTSYTRAVMQIHDELIYEVHESIQDNFINIVKRCMENKVQIGLNITVPLITNVNIGINWGTMIAYERKNNDNINSTVPIPSTFSPVLENNNIQENKKVIVNTITNSENKRESPIKRKRQND